jgi:hypothetical protein
MKEQKLRKIIRETIREEQFLYGSDDVARIVRQLFPNAQIERAEQGRVPGGSGEVVTLRNGMTFLVASDLKVFDENGRKSEAAELLEVVIRNQVR